MNVSKTMSHSFGTPDCSMTPRQIQIVHLVIMMGAIISCSLRLQKATNLTTGNFRLVASKSLMT